MIEGFEQFTHKLTNYELRMAEVIAVGLENKVGRERAVTSDHIIEKMKGVGWSISGSRLRKMINYLRITGRVRNLICSSRGYYRSVDKREIQKYVRTLNHRAEAIQAVARSFDGFYQRPVASRKNSVVNHPYFE
jgi:hypothetical protein